MSEETTGTQALQLVRLQKVTRFAQFLRLVRIFRAFPYLAQSLLFKRIRSLRGTRIVNFIVVLLWVVHLVACGWYLVASLHDDHQETWIGRRIVDTRGTTLYEASPEEQWLHAMYFVLAVFTTVGFGDIAAVTSAEVAYALLTMMIGIVINSIIVGKMVTAVTRVDQQDIERSKQKDLVERGARGALAAADGALLVEAAVRAAEKKAQQAASPAASAAKVARRRRRRQRLAEARRAAGGGAAGAAGGGGRAVPPAEAADDNAMEEEEEEALSIDDSWADAPVCPSARRRRARSARASEAAEAASRVAAAAAEPVRVAGGAADAAAGSAAGAAGPVEAAEGVNEAEAEPAAVGGAAAVVPLGERSGERAALLAKLAASGMFNQSLLSSIESLNIVGLRHLVSQLPN
ncbi:unnamed protein product [Prorocentrum cordatum]|uniref:Potassium channel domain-containing protein n=1 Tax=Prorocentrum cordatum TaxID=2364126 RepID=A0ABN9YI02_9DINO|nr:unnamed protein product [Polarella glacialis]